jgi:hypothetical protein
VIPPTRRFACYTHISIHEQPKPQHTATKSLLLHRSPATHSSNLGSDPSRDSVSALDRYPHAIASCRSPCSHEDHRTRQRSTKTSPHPRSRLCISRTTSHYTSKFYLNFHLIQTPATQPKAFFPFGYDAPNGHRLETNIVTRLFDHSTFDRS